MDDGVSKKHMSGKQQLSINELLHNLTVDAEELEKRVNENLLQISEIDEYLNSIMEQEDKDFKVFSPRNVEHIYREEIQKHKEQKYKLEIENRSLYSRLNKCNAYFNAISEALNKETNSKNLKVLDIQEKERQRIARDLHDTSLQNLTYLVHKIELASMYIDKDALQAKLELATISKSLKSVIDEIRETIFDLRPMSFDDLGLKEALERLFAKLKEKNHSIDFYTEIAPISCEDNLVLMTIFRVVQEACSNAVSHSNGNRLEVVIKQENEYCNITIKDNGLGFSKEDMSEKMDRHFGIGVMKERINLLGGEIFFDSVLNEGTEIKIHIPIA